MQLSVDLNYFKKCLHFAQNLTFAAFANVWLAGFIFVPPFRLTIYTAV
jgi:hypothetical protein